MPVPPITAALFLGSVFMAMFAPAVLLWYAPLGFLVLTVFSLVFYRKSHAEIKKEAAGTDARREPSALPETGRNPGVKEIASLKEKTSALETKLDGQRRNIEILQDRLIAFLDAVDKERVLSEIIKKKTEEATLRLTDHVYEIVESGNRMSSSIKKVFAEIATGDHSLDKDAETLNDNTGEVSETIEEFRKIFMDFAHDKSAIQQMVSDINQYTQDISEMADLTQVLGINASIEAARVGIRGKGFAVISGEVQKLALRSKTISDSINANVCKTAASIMDSYETQTERIQAAFANLEKTRSIQGGIAEALTPKVKELAAGTDDCHNLSCQITANLDKVTVHLQYQDMVRQVLCHMTDYLELLRQETEAALSEQGVESKFALSCAKSKNLDKLKTLFTTREELEAFGIQVDRGKAVSAGGDLNKDGEGCSDVTLF